MWEWPEIRDEKNMIKEGGVIIWGTPLTLEKTVAEFIQKMLH